MNPGLSVDADSTADQDQPPAFGGPEDLVNDAVVEEVSDGLLRELRERNRSEIDLVSDDTAVSGLTRSNLRDAVGDIERSSEVPEGQTPEQYVEHLGIEAKHFQDLADGEEDPIVKNLYKAAVRRSIRNRDIVRVENGLRPESEEALSILEEEVAKSNELRLSRFKRWAKKNMVGLSGVAITVAGIVTAIVMASKKALVAGASALGKFGRAVARVLAKLGPVFAALGSLIGTVLSWGARGIAWLASNLWVLAIAVAAALYSEYRGRRE